MAIALNCGPVFRPNPNPNPNPNPIPFLNLATKQSSLAPAVLRSKTPHVFSAQISSSSSSSSPPSPSPSPSDGKVSSEHRARFAAAAKRSLSIEEGPRPLGEYMSLPASQYSVLDAERIERIDENTFRCYVYRLKFFGFEVCPVLLVRVDEEPDGCCIRLLSCTLEGSPLVVEQNKKFSASMVNKVSWSYSDQSSTLRCLNSDAMIEVIIEVPLAFRLLPVEVIENTGTQVLGQLLRAMLPRFLDQLQKDYIAWASGDASRRPLGTGEI